MFIMTLIFTVDKMMTLNVWKFVMHDSFNTKIRDDLYSKGQLSCDTFKLRAESD